MRVLYLTALSLFVSISFVFGQGWGGEAKTYNIIGRLVEAGLNAPVEFATVSIFNQSDSSLVSGGLTDDKGRFDIEVKPGSYYLVAQFLGFRGKSISNINIGRGGNPTFELGTLSLEQDEELLEEVVIQAERTQMELTLDKKVYNIGKDLSNLGGSASDLLANLPSVQVDVEGNVSLRGSENVQILVDGKPSGLIGLSGTGGLQQLQGNLIESVEIITNPSSRYDAEGGAGIINIILKKDKARGFNGSFQAQVGAPDNHGASVNVNYRTGWINWFVNYGVTYRKFPGEGYTNNYFNYPESDSVYYINQINDRSRSGLAQNVRFGSDIYFNEKNVMTLSASYRNSDDENITQTSYDFLNRNLIQFADRFRVDNEDEDDLNWQYEVNFNREFARKDQELSFTLQFQESNEVEISAFDDITTYSDNTVDDLLQRSENDNGETRTLVQLDYVHPFSRNAKFEGGLRYNFRNIFNDYIVESDSTKSGTYEEVTALTNDFNFDEGIFAAYFILSNKVNKFSWQVGTRAEQTDLETLLEQTDESNNQNYLSFFPSANVTYQYSKLSSLQLSYSRRITRPRFRSLNPFVTYSNPLSIFTGNPNLQPQFTDSYELGILQNNKSNSIYIGVYYRHTDDVVQRIQIPGDQEGVTIRLPQNLAVQNDIGLETNISQEFGKFFRTTTNINFYNSDTDGENPETGEDISAVATTVSVRANAFYRNPKLLNAQATIFYRAPRNTAQGVSKSIGNFDLGFSKDILSKNGTLALNVSDLFNSRKYRGETITETFTTESLFQWRRGPTATLSFTYRLNQKKQRPDRKRNGGYEGGGFEEF